jgi:hypothetical protein
MSQPMSPDTFSNAGTAFGYVRNSVFDVGDIQL